MASRSTKPAGCRIVIGKTKFLSNDANVGDAMEVFALADKYHADKLIISVKVYGPSSDRDFSKSTRALVEEDGYPINHVTR